jgi:hypothetical protein
MEQQSKHLGVKTTGIYGLRSYGQLLLPVKSLFLLRSHKDDSFRRQDLQHRHHYRFSIRLPTHDTFYTQQWFQSRKRVFLCILIAKATYTVFICSFSMRCMCICTWSCDSSVSKANNTDCKDTDVFTITNASLNHVS